MATTSRIVQVLLGAVVGFVFAWAGLQVIPVQSGALTAVLTMVAAVVVAAIVMVFAPRTRTAAIAFATAAVLVSALVLVVVA